MPVSNSSVLAESSDERRRLAVDRPEFGGLDRTQTVDRLAEQIEDAPKRFLADRHLHRFAGIGHGHAADQAVGRAESHAADAVASQVLLDLAGQAQTHALVVGVDPESIVNLRQMVFLELGVKGRTNHLDDASGVLAVACRCCHLKTP